MSMKKNLVGVMIAVSSLFGMVATAPVAHAACAVDTDACSNASTPSFTVNAGDGPRFDDVVAGADGETAQEIYPVVGNFGDVTLNGTPQLTSAEIPPFTVIDDSGAGAGWNVQLQVTDFDDGLVLPLHKHVVDSSLMAMNGPVISPGTSSSAMGGVWSKGYNNGFKTARKICIADPADVLHNGGAPVGNDGNTKVAGQGTYLISPQILKLVVPEDTTPATYTATATFTISSGP